jgi:integrase
VLTDTKLRSAKAAERPYKLSDAGGLYLLVKPTGSKLWQLKYRVQGKERTASFGPYPEVSLAEARGKRDLARKQLKDGIDPVQFRKQEKAQASVAAANTFGAIYQEWLEVRKTKWTSGYFADVKSRIDANLLPNLADLPITSITSLQLLTILRRIEARGALNMAKRCRMYASGIFSYAIATGRAETDPAATLIKALKSAPIEHFAALPWNEMGTFLRELSTYPSPKMRLAVKLLILTATRTSELRGAKWSEIEDQTWTIPAERMKARREHIVPLSRQARAILDQLRPVSGHRQHLFPNERHPHRHMSDYGILSCLHGLGYGGRATGHGFRAVFSTVMNEARFAHDAIERQLAHVEKDKVRAAYHRAEYLDERRRLMQAWADKLDEVEEGVG